MIVSSSEWRCACVSHTVLSDLPFKNSSEGGWASQLESPRVEQVDSFDTVYIIIVAACAKQVGQPLSYREQEARRDETI